MPRIDHLTLTGIDLGLGTGRPDDAVWLHWRDGRVLVLLMTGDARCNIAQALPHWAVQLADDAPWPALLGQWLRPGASAVECVSAADLTREGQAMGHCVGSYDRHCAHFGQRILHLTVGDARATLQVAPLGADEWSRYQHIELLGPRNAPVDRAMQAWAAWVLRRINQRAAWGQRQAVLDAADQQRLSMPHPRRDRPTDLQRIDPTSQAHWLALLRGGLPQPLTRWHPGQVLLDCELAGVDHHDAQACWPTLAAGQKLTLVREPANPHDAQAVRVDAASGCLGYLPRAQNHKVAQALDAGTPLQARLTGLSDGAAWGLRLWMRVKCVP